VNCSYVIVYSSLSADGHAAHPDAGLAHVGGHAAAQ